MHELGIVKHVMKQVSRVADENSLTEVGSVTLEIGEVSGIVGEQLADCWNYFRKKDPRLLNAELLILKTPAVTFCTSCGKEYETVRYGRICPHCGSEETYLLTGNGSYIKEIEAR